MFGATAANDVVPFVTLICTMAIGVAGIYWIYVQVKRGRSTGWLKVIFVVFDTPESQWERAVYPFPTGFVLIENHGPFEEFVSGMNYSVEGKGVGQVLCHRQAFARAADKIKEVPYEQRRFDEAIEASQRHSEKWIHAKLDSSITAIGEWQQESNAVRKEVEDAFTVLKNEKGESIFIEYPLSIGPGRSTRIDFDIPERWEADLGAITCLTVQTSKEIIHVKRGHVKPSSPCKKCRSSDQKFTGLG